MSTRFQTPTWVQASLLALILLALFQLWLGAPVTWPTLWIPLAGGVFTLLWLRITRQGRPGLALLLWIFGLHLALWLPFLLDSYLGGQGGRAIPEAIVTTVIVAWYSLEGQIWPTLGAGLALLILLGLLRALTGETR